MTASSSRGGAAAVADDDDEPYLLGFIISKIVGMLYYRGKVAGREPLNRYDNNAIAVFNARNDQVGHLPGVLAAVLAPLLDSHLLVAAQGIMPRSGSKFNPNAYSLPCQVHLFARPAAASVVEAALHEAGIDLIHVDHLEFILSQASAVMEQFKKPDRDRDVDKLFSLVGKEGKNQTQRMDPPGDVVHPSSSDTRRRRWGGWCTGRSLPTCRPSGKKVKMGGSRTCLPIKRRRNDHRR
jgi:SWI/SNF-related matrix-associated actin-dependent regulator of chromatin subfamily A3